MPGAESETQRVIRVFGELRPAHQKEHSATAAEIAASWKHSPQALYDCADKVLHFDRVSRRKREGLWCRLVERFGGLKPDAPRQHFELAQTVFCDVVPKIVGNPRIRVTAIALAQTAIRVRLGRHVSLTEVPNYPRASETKLLWEPIMGAEGYTQLFGSTLDAPLSLLENPAIAFHVSWRSVRPPADELPALPQPIWDLADSLCTPLLSDSVFSRLDAPTKHMITTFASIAETPAARLLLAKLSAELLDPDFLRELLSFYRHYYSLYNMDLPQQVEAYLQRTMGHVADHRYDAHPGYGDWWHDWRDTLARRWGVQDPLHQGGKQRTTPATELSRGS